MRTPADPASPTHCCRRACVVVSRLLATRFTLALAFVALGGSAARAQMAASQAASLTLRPGDALKLSVWMAKELDGEYFVAPDGTLAHPAFRGLVVTGVSMTRLQDKLDSAARAVSNVGANATFQPLLRVIVDGEVRAPNLYRLPAGTSVAEAVVLAGGRTDRANTRRLALVRDGATTYYDLSDPSGPASRLALQSGDQLLLERRRSFGETILPLTSVLGAAASIATLVLRDQ